MNYFNDVIEIAVSEGQAATGRELISVYSKRVEYNLHIYERERQNCAEKTYVIDLSQEDEPDSVYRCLVDLETFRGFKRDQRVRIAFEKFPEMIVSFARKVKENSSAHFFSCTPSAEDRKKYIQFELTEHSEYKSTSVLSLKMKGLEGADLIQHLTNILKKDHKWKSEVSELKKANDDLSQELNEFRESLKRVKDNEPSVNVGILQHDLQEYKDRAEDLEDELEKVRDELEQKIEQCNEREYDLVDLEKFYTEAEEANAALQQEKMEWKGKFDDLTKSYELVYQEYRDLLRQEGNMNELKELYLDERRENEILRRDLNAANSKSEELQRQLDILNLKYAELKKKMLKVSQSLADVNEKRKMIPVSPCTPRNENIGP